MGPRSLQAGNKALTAVASLVGRIVVGIVGRFLIGLTVFAGLCFILWAMIRLLAG